MKRSFNYLIALLISINSLAQTKEVYLSDLLNGVPAIKGKAEYLQSPFTTTGNRLYIVGHQDGSFPEIGWHIPGEMGGIWNHPIKLFDGFKSRVKIKGEVIDLDDATYFKNYPIASDHAYHIEKHQIQIKRFQFVPMELSGMAIQYEFSNDSDLQKEIEFRFSAYSDLRPTWLGEKTGMIDHVDIATYQEQKNSWVFKDSLNDWFGILTSDGIADQHHKLKSDYNGKGTGAQLEYRIVVPANSKKQLTFYLSGSNDSYNSAWKDLNILITDLQKEFINKKQRFDTISGLSKLTIPDKELEQTFEWLKYNSEWLIQEVPGIGTGITAGIPDYPWWFGVDSEYALKGYMAIGQTDAVYNTIKLLDSVSYAVNGNGKIIHEMSTNGAVFNDGNINETPQFTSLIWEIYKWNGNKEFLKNYFPTIKSGLDWLMKNNDPDKNMFPNGFGMMEIHGLDSEMIDVAVYTQRAFHDAAEIAFELQMDSLAKRYKQTAIKLKDKINDEFWSEEFNSYADFIGTDEQAIKLLNDAIIRADTLGKPWSVKELENTKNYILKNPSNKPRPFVLHHNWVVNTPMEMKIADRDKALKALKTAEKYINPFGVFVTGIDRDETSLNDATSFKGSKVFSYTGAVMTLPTGVQAIAENNYGNPDKALDYLKRMTRSFSYAFPGSMYEVSPDYGMITQAWNIYSFAVPIVHQFFGIEPLAHRNKIVIAPQFPVKWENASLENVRIKDNSVSIFYSMNNGNKQYEILMEKSGWTIELQLPESEYDILSDEVLQTSENGKTIFTTPTKRLIVVERN